MIGAKLIPSVCAFTLPLKKPVGTTTCCYTAAEVAAMIGHCRARAELAWLGDVIVALTHTGLRIGELAALRRRDLDDELTKVALLDESRRAARQHRAAARTTKTHRGRVLPVHPSLREILLRMKSSPHRDGRVFHGPSAGILKPDTVRNILEREVLVPLAKRFPASPGGQGLADGRLHSFRHYFCSTSANGGVPEQVLMEWLGHGDSKMVRHYYHPHDRESHRHMNKINFAGAADAMLAAAKPA